MKLIATDHSGRPGSTARSESRAGGEKAVEIAQRLVAPQMVLARCAAGIERLPRIDRNSRVAPSIPIA
jgi:hypothetical protein